MSEFVHLHNHTDYSLLDAAQSVEMMCKRLDDIGMDTIAVTEHGNLFSMVHFYKEAKKAGIKPILGCEVYVATGKHTNKTIDKTAGKWNYHHLLLLVQNQTGLKNLMSLVSIGYIEGFYYRPRVDKDLLKKYSEGLICTNACLAGEVTHHASKGNYEEAKKAALEYKEIFDSRFYLEIQNHGLAEELASHEILTKLSKDLDIPLVATNDNHYAFEEHSTSHDILFCCGMGKEISDENRLKYAPKQFYIKTEDEMYKLFKQTPQAIENSKIIADSCSVDLKMGNYLLPEFPIPSNELNGPDEYLKSICMAGLEERYKDITPKLLTRLDYELGVIKKMGFAGYFLITQDFVKYAKNNQIPVGPGRGSAVGSLVSYCSGITDVDPLKYNLLFERFLNPERISMPDIDIDFCIEGRDHVINYIKSKYGNDSVAQIITFGRMKAKSSIRDVGRVLGMPYGQVDDIAKMIPNELNITIEKSLSMNKDLKSRYESDDKVRELINHSQVLEGMHRHASTHAAGVVITPGPLTDYVPLYKNPTSGDITTQFEMNALEDLGLLKMDFLGLRNLTVIDKALKLINDRYDLSLSTLDMKLDDSKVMQLFAKGNTIGIFQFDSQGMREYLKQLMPTRFEDLIAMTSLYRPGPMQNIPEFIKRKLGLSKITYLDPKLEPILKDTYGIIVFQEQVMQIGAEIGGFTLAQSDLMRKAMGKKKKRLMATFKVDFVKGAQEKNISQEVAINIFDLLERFAEYGFNKSHATGYSLISYQTAWLKTYYPAEFFATNLSSDVRDTDNLIKLIDDAENFNISISVPDVNISSKDFDVLDKNTISFGLSGIKNVGAKAAESIEQHRKKEKCKYKTIFDLVSIGDNVINRKSLESLILSGATSQLDGSISQQFDGIDTALKYAQHFNKKTNINQGNIFASGGVELDYPVPQLPDSNDWKKSDILAKEKEYLGMYLSGNPMESYIDDIKDFEIIPKKFNSNSLVRAGGIISNINLLYDKRNNPWTILTLEGLKNKSEIFIFNKLYEIKKSLLEENNIIFIEGKFSNRQTEDDKILKIIADDIVPIADIRNKFSNSLNIKISQNQVSPDLLKSIKSIAKSNLGHCKIIFHFEIGKGHMQRVVSEDLKVKPSRNLISDLRSMIGNDNIWVS